MAEGVDELSPWLIGGTEIDECAEKEEKQAGRGAYGFVFKVTVQGVERVGKKLHSSLNVSGSKMRSNFRDECVILSKLRHPNIVQFIGVHYGRRGKTDLTLIMECVSSDMQEFLEGHPNLPLPVKLSILLDVSYGLVYLHEWDPNTPIVHRDLTARNMLITDKCQAKIADLGMAKVVDIQAQMAVSHTQTPGQMFYMPPEALMEKASCTPKLDIFSFGHLTLFTVNQEFPEVYDITQNSDILRMQRRGTIQRCKRQTALDRVGEDHCLYSVITDCLSDKPENRPTTRVLNNRMIHLSTLNPASVESVMEVFSSKCGNPQCKLKLDKMFADFEAELYKASRLTETVKRLEKAKSDAVGETARVKAESDIYKSDFLEERKDRERAQGALDALKTEMENRDAVFKKELALYREQNKSSKAEINTFKSAIQALKSKLEKMNSEREYDAQQSKKAIKGEKSREFEMQFQHATMTAVDLINQIDCLRQEKKKMQKALSRAEARIQDSSDHPQASESRRIDMETLYAEERDRNKRLQDEIGYLNNELERYKSVIVTASPGDDSEETLVSHTTKSNPLRVPGKDVDERSGAHSMPSNGSAHKYFTSIHQKRQSSSGVIGTRGRSYAIKL